MIQLRHLCALFAVLPALANGQALKLASKSQGGSFFDAWNVNGSDTDPTQYGNIHYLNDTAALQAQLIGVNKAGNAILKVDNTTNDPNPGEYSTFGRNSVLIISKDTIDLGTLVVMDAVHIPFGCSVWPAFWTLDSVTHTDEGGEIDIIESVNLMQNNQFSLHAKEGCTLQKNTSMPFTGTQIYEDCNYVFNVTGNRGCGIQETQTQNNLGEAFAKNGGGVYAMYWSNNGIQMWFFPRNNIPQDLSTESPDPSKWPEASASFPPNGCNPRTFFNPQNMIININICGAWAANADVYPTTGCQGKCTDKVGTASNYNDAYWEITYVKTFTAQGNTTATSSNSASTTGSSGTNVPTAGPNAAMKTTLGGAWIASALGVIALFALVI